MKEYIVIASSNDLDLEHISQNNIRVDIVIGKEEKNRKICGYCRYANGEPRAGALVRLLRSIRTKTGICYQEVASTYSNEVGFYSFLIRPDDTSAYRVAAADEVEEVQEERNEEMRWQKQQCFPSLDRLYFECSRCGALNHLGSKKYYIPERENKKEGEIRACSEETGEPPQNESQQKESPQKESPKNLPALRRQNCFLNRRMNRNYLAK